MPIIILILLNILLIIITISIKRHNKIYIFHMGLVWVMLNLIIFSLIFINFNNFFSFQFTFRYSWILFNYSFLNWGNLLITLDGVSLLFLGLSILLIPICLLVSFKTINFFYKEFVILLFLNLIFLILVFSVFDILGFYILFESLLIPMFLIIGVWGSRKEKIKAAFYFFFYTLIGSLLMLISVFKIYTIAGSCNYNNLVCLNLPYNLQIWLFIGFFLSLSVKVPMIPFHIWLPQAHVEAPIAGSVLLAGVLLKLGGYGFIRFSFPLFPLASQFFSPLLILLSLISIIYGALTTCRQIDIKRLIAYSSVSHMGLVTMSIFCHSLEGLLASILMMLAHGLVSSGLFMSSSVLYWRYHSRLIKYFKSLAVSMPIFSIIVFLLILGNISFPMTFNFIAEFLSLLTIIKLSKLIGLLCCFGAFLGIIYSFYFFNRVFFGFYSPFLIYPRDLNLLEFNSFLPLIALMLLLGIYPNFIVNILNFSSLINITL